VLAISQLFGAAGSILNRFTGCYKILVLAALCCSCSFIVGDENDQSQENDNDNDNDGSASDNDDDNDTGELDTDTGELDTDTEELDTDTEPDACPWSCKTIDVSNFSTCDPSWDGSEQNPPIEVRHPHLDKFCGLEALCCQPRGVVHPLALTVHCLDLGLACELPSSCDLSSVSTIAYCNSTKYVCCNNRKVER
jgi:hypothetical protein